MQQHYYCLILSMVMHLVLSSFFFVFPQDGFPLEKTNHINSLPLSVFLIYGDDGGFIYARLNDAGPPCYTLESLVMDVAANTSLC